MTYEKKREKHLESVSLHATMKAQHPRNVSEIRLLSACQLISTSIPVLLRPLGSHKSLMWYEI